jgi:hypothetical protein
MMIIFHEVMMMKQWLKRSLALVMALAVWAGAFALTASADGTAIIGEITITYRNRGNIRSGPGTHYPVVGNTAPGETYQTTGLNGNFYEIVMSNGAIAYVHKNLAAFTAYQSPVPADAQYSIPVYYRTSTGQTLYTGTVPVKVGQNTVTANDTLVPGYRLVSTRSIYVSVDKTGRAFPSGVVFLYEPGYAPTATPTAAPAPTTASLLIQYKNIYGQVLASEVRSLGAGTHLVPADSSKVPYGYALSGIRDAVVFVSAAGVPNPSSVSFVVIQQAYQPTATPRPAAYATIPVNYQDEYGNHLYSTSQTLPQGYTTIAANDSRVPAGYVLTSPRNVSVYVSGSGAATPASVTFTYRRPVSASVQVLYQDTSGNILNSETRALSQGTNIITANDSLVPAGYVLASSRSITVTVDAGGYATPGTVVFTYSRPVTATIQVIYKDTSGDILYTETRTLSQGSNAVTTNDGLVPAGYVLQGYRSIAVTVYPDGSLSQSRVEFTYAPPAPPVTVNIPVIYKDHTGATLGQTTASVTSASPNTVRADNSMAPPNYVLTSPASVTVRVSPDGTATPAQVVFTYRDRGTIVSIPTIDQYQTLRLTGSYPVYSGPGYHYYQAPNAVVSGGRSRVYGSENGWILMGYGLSDGRYRIGWVEASALPADAHVSELAFAHSPAKAVNLVRVYDDPIMKPTTVFEIQPGGTFTVLATQRDGYYAYIETEYNGQPYRGFVNQKNIQLQ